MSARPRASIDDLNQQADEWAVSVAEARPWPQDKTRKVRDAWVEEQPKLLSLPGDTFPADERIEVSVGKTPYVRFDLNDYSVPHQHVRQTLTLVASLTRVRILSEAAVIADHARSWDRAQQIEDPGHLAALTKEKRQARKGHNLSRLLQLSPSCRAFIELAADRGANLGRLTQELTQLLDVHGSGDLEEALVEALERDRAHVGAVRHVLDRNRAARGLPPPVSMPSGPARHANLVVKPHDLGSYDHINQEARDE